MYRDISVHFSAAILSTLFQIPLRAFLRLLFFKKKKFDSEAEA
jgi:hypothetical protein